MGEENINHDQAFDGVIEVWDWVLEKCPNRRVKHLMTYGKNERIRRKNFKHAVRLISKFVAVKGE